MNISVSMYSLAPTVKAEKWSVIDFIDYAHSISLQGVELLDIFWGNPDDQKEEMNLVKETLKKYGMRVSAYDVSNNFVKANEAERAKDVAHVIEGIHIAKELGTNVVRVFCGDLSGDLSYEDGHEWIIDSLKICAEVAEKEAVYLAIENHGLLAGKSGQVKDVITQVGSPYVKSTFDTGNFLLVHEEPTAAFEHLKEEIVHVHFKDFREKEPTEDVKSFKSIEGVAFVGVVPGDGAVDLASIVKGLKDIDYNGWLSIEYEGLEEPEEATFEAVKRLKQLI